MGIIVKKKTYRDIFRQLHTQEYKAMKKYIFRLLLNLAPSTSFHCKRNTKKRFSVFSKPLWDKIGFR